MNIEIIADNARKGDYYAIMQLKNISTNEYNSYADRVLENIYYDGNKNHAVGIIVLREGIKEIQPDEFKNCTKLEKIILPDSLISIGDNAFEGCFRLEKVFFPDNLKSIGQRAFFGCKSLEKIILPDNVSIGKDAFAGCNQNFFQPVQVPQQIQQNISQPVQQKNIVYYDGNKKNAVGTIYLREGITEIEDNEFRDCKKLEKVILPESLTSIGRSSFEYCTNLKLINFPESLTSICDFAFYNCTSLKEIKFPKSLTSIGFLAFDYCTNLEKITYYKTTENILKNYFGWKWSKLQKTVIY
ncbi:MAG: leucine-rich repeat domain-containing protein [Selenomonadaceae bacterium]|nr:leucine-rich repeat domain-containing protein [Selenomonadaceae bacterium]